MNLLSFTVVLGLLVGTWAQPIVRRPLCDSPEAEEAALVAQDYLNGQHHHGYKYVLNQIDDIKVYTKVSQQVETKSSYVRYFLLIGAVICSPASGIIYTAEFSQSPSYAQHF